VGTQFDVVVPVRVAGGKAKTTFYTGYSLLDGNGDEKLMYVSARQIITAPTSAPAVADSYGPVLTGYFLNQ